MFINYLSEQYILQNVSKVCLMSKRKRKKVMKFLNLDS